MACYSASVSKAGVLAPPPLPHEHGAWMMLAIPLLLGMAAAWPPSAAAWLIVPALALLFLSRSAAVPAATRLIGGKKAPEGFVLRRGIWSLVYLVAAVLLLAAAWSLSVPGARRRLLAVGACTLVLGGAQTAFAFADRARSIWGVLLGMAGLASGAPLVVAAAGRPLDRRAIGAGLVAMLYFATSLAYVRAVRGLWKGEGTALRRCFAAHAAVAGALATLAAGSFITPLLAAAFVPAYVRTAWGLLRPPSNLRVLGWREIGVAVLFALIATASFALPA
jgi:hypothetical protein